MNELNSIYRESLNFTRNHYENFPVVSFLIKKELRKYVAVIYRFARRADDIADEGDAAPEKRIEMLNGLGESLSAALKGNFATRFEEALFHTINDKSLSPEHFFNLLTAFKQDVCKKRYDSFDELLNYCSYSANPVGRLILELYGIRNEDSFLLSDKICTALQLTNFYQDTLIDYKRGRIYYPRDEMEKFGVDIRIFDLKENNLNFSKLLKFNIDRTYTFFDQGKKLLDYLHGRLKLEIKWTILGGKAILKKIVQNNYDVFSKRPVLTKTDFASLFLYSLVK